MRELREVCVGGCLATVFYDGGGVVGSAEQRRSGGGFVVDVRVPVVVGTREEAWEIIQAMRDVARVLLMQGDEDGEGVCLSPDLEARVQAGVELGVSAVVGE
jgi:hypothetical protein